MILPQLIKKAKDIVLLATMLSDCMLGPAFEIGGLSRHTDLAVEKANEILSDFPEANNDEKENISYSIKEHHGVDEFYSKEAEISCNADCYRFVSIRGLLAVIRGSKEYIPSVLQVHTLSRTNVLLHARALPYCVKIYAICS